MAPDAVDAVLRAAHGWNEQAELARLRRDRSSEAQRSDHWQRVAHVYQDEAERWQGIARTWQESAGRWRQRAETAEARVGAQAPDTTQE